MPLIYRYCLVYLTYIWYMIRNIRLYNYILNDPNLGHLNGMTQFGSVIFDIWSMSKLNLGLT